MIKSKFVKTLATGLLACVLVFSTGCGPAIDLSDFFDDRVENGSSGSTSGSSLNTGVGTSLFSADMVRQPKVKLKGNGDDTVTVLMYMNGSNLESDSGEATTDLTEILKAEDSDKVNILVQTMGTKKWKNYGIASDRSQIYSIDEDGVNLVKDDMGQLDCTEAETLENFIKWGVTNYPADRYILLLWNHGGGPVYGYGYDEWNDDEYAALTIDEMQTALSNAGTYFDFIGMDCCIMSCLELCVALYDYCDYAILSEDFEPGIGWSYTGWVSALCRNTSISTPELGKIIVDDMVAANEADSYGGGDAILAVIDEAMMKVLWTAWVDFAYKNEAGLLANNFSREVKGQGRELPSMARYGGFDFDYSYTDFYSSDDPTMSSYYITDIMALASTMDTDESRALASALGNTLIYVNATKSDEYLSGMSVTLPYGDAVFYGDLKKIFTNCGLDGNYISWLEKFVTASGSGSYYDYSDWEDDWSGWDDYEDDWDWSLWDWFSDDNDDYWYGWDDDDCWGTDYYEYGDSDYSWFYELFGDDDYYYDGYYYDDDYYDDDYYDDDYYGYDYYFDEY